MWYSASLLFKRVRDKKREAPSLWEEIIVLVQAKDEVHAHQQVEVIGHSRAHEYHAGRGTPHLVEWSFSQVERVCALDVEKIETGTEVFSRFLRQSEVDSLLTPFPEENMY
jgi:hypothetical protein